MAVDLEHSRAGIVWLTGLSGAGKSTLAAALRAALPRHRVEVLDGDEVRAHLSRGLGFSREDRDENVRRIAYVACLLAKQGVLVIVAAISPFAQARREAREQASAHRLWFAEVHLNAPLEALERRDVKGLYRQARAGQLEGFTGVTAPYEVPLAPELAIDSSVESLSQSTERVLTLLRAHGWLDGRAP